MGNSSNLYRCWYSCTDLAQHQEDIYNHGHGISIGEGRSRGPGVIERVKLREWMEPGRGALGVDGFKVTQIPTGEWAVYMNISVNA